MSSVSEILPNPGMWPGAELLNRTGEHEPYQHGFVLNVFLGVEPALGAPPPHVRPHDGAEHHYALPGPEGREDRPPRPALQDAVQLEGVEDGEDEQAAEHHELGRVEVLQEIER